MLIKNGLIAFPDGIFRKADIFIKDGIISEISIKSGRKSENIIDASEKWVFPGGIDPHVHFDDPGFTHREDFYTGSCAAAQGGITTIIDMPCTSIPPVINKENFYNKLKIIEKKAVVDFGLFGGINGNSFVENLLESTEELVSCGIAGMKCYAISGMETFPRVNNFQFEKILSVSQKLNIPILLHAENFDYVHHKTEEFSNENSWEAYYFSRSEICEILAVSRAVLQTESIEGADLHIVHVGTAKAAEMIANSEVTCETCPHYLEFDKGDFAKYGSALKTAPVVKQGQRQALWELLRQGQINFVASDHAPAPASEKNTGSVWADYGGIPGVGTIYPYMLSEGLGKNRLNLKQFLEVTTMNAAKRYGFWDRKGSIEIGKEADLLIINPKGKFIVNTQNFYTKGETSPFNGMIFDYLIEKTIVRGKIVYDLKSGIVTERGWGRFISPKR